MTDASRRRTSLFARRSRREMRRISAILREETVGGALLLGGALLALIWSNSPWAESYHALRNLRIGPSSPHLDLSLATWAADGLLAIFFFVAGLELKREFVDGDLRDPRCAAVPVAAAVGGVLVPAVLYLLIAGDGAAKGWAIPTATDIAFALAVLAVAGRFMPPALRTFLLTLAVVDDLLAIIIIAVCYTTHLAVLPLLGASIPLALFAMLIRQQARYRWWLLPPLAVVTWAMVHASGVHATVAGVLLAFTVPVTRDAATGGPDGGPGPAEHLEHRLRPISAGVAVPIFAFLSAGVTVGDPAGLAAALTDRVAVGIVVGLVLGKPIGIMAATWLVSRFTRAELDAGLTWLDVLGLASLGGIGFTVSLLIGELAFGLGSERDGHAKIAVLTGSLLAAILATLILRARSRLYRRVHRTETVLAGH